MGDESELEQRAATCSVCRVKDGHPFLPFRSVPFRWLWCTSGLATGAQLMERTTTSWLVLQLGGGALAVGLAFAARSLPSLLFGLASGTLADRIDRRRQLLTVAVLAAFVMFFLGWLTGTGDIRIWQVIVIAFVAGTIQVGDVPARQALVLDTTSREDASTAMTLNALASRGFGAVGAITAGALIPIIGVGHCYYVIAAVYVVELIPLLALRVPRIARAAAGHPPFRRALRDAVSLIVNVPAVRILSVSGIACEVLAFSHSSALPVLARDVLKVGPEGLGTMNAAVSIGGTLSLLLLLAFRRIPRQPLLAAIFLTFGACLVVLSTSHNLSFAAGVLVMTGLCAAGFDVLQQTLLQLAVPDEQRGRAAGIWVVGLGSAPIGYIEVGALVSVVGAPLALVINGGLTILSAVTLLARAPSFRWNVRARISTR